jgi:acetyl/propionyl-CoA carboxylase alpha subunit
VSWTTGRDGGVDAEVVGLPIAGRTLDVVESHILLELGGASRCYWVTRLGDTWYVNSSLGQTDLVEMPRFPEPTAAAQAGGPTAPVPGRIVAVEVLGGDLVQAGQTLVVLEAMKVEHQIRAIGPATVVEILVEPGETVDAHQLLIRLEDTP